jgi:hypothetical protein
LDGHVHDSLHSQQRREGTAEGHSGGKGQGFAPARAQGGHQENPGPEAKGSACSACSAGSSGLKNRKSKKTQKTIQHHHRITILCMMHKNFILLIFNSCILQFVKNQ